MVDQESKPNGAAIGGATNQHVGEPRWAMAAAVLAAELLHATLPSHFRAVNQLSPPADSNPPARSDTSARLRGATDPKKPANEPWPTSPGMRRTPESGQPPLIGRQSGPHAERRLGARSR
jgi:hypothetical protein